MFSTHTKTGRNNMVGYTVAKIRKQQLIISQRELADRLNSLGWDIDKNGIQRIESGERFVNDMELIYLTRLFNMTIPELYNDVPSIDTIKFNANENSKG